MQHVRDGRERLGGSVAVDLWLLEGVLAPRLANLGLQGTAVVFTGTAEHIGAYSDSSLTLVYVG